MDKRVNRALPRGRSVAAFFLCILLALRLAVPAQAADLEGKKLVPMGNTIGIHMECRGVLVVGLCEADEGSHVSPAADSGIRPGDLITHINAAEVTTAEQLKAELAASAGKTVSVRLERDGKEMQFAVEPTADGRNTLGVMIRDAITGIGTMTCYDPESGAFAALGHSISDVDTGVLLPLKSGKLLHSSVESVVRGECGAPGELCGKFDLTDEMGTITANTEYGIFGRCEPPTGETGEAVALLPRAQLHAGRASVLANINGSQVESFEIEIVRLYPENAGGRDMMISVVDERLLDACGGIVQGMSGSPILQDGCLAGAVTHVLVDDPTRGYAISIETMLGSMC